ncbi:hypothetical protein SARC_07021 [Sphaeroforma arctica JP610]|uniref:Arf-GAP domain-containing protein n=1 Tax=Sphaeroforma arctica JP610 TaxID=667725 RepID=A0A0L0FUW0_9EUKA|nr:hypothetical protein SARC_07021 [Sphaeroforma arctica JP610]KNC80630.1 hypothetical protein SARC_07021 [Sphaeroforma arctica JP610]|eukprot:XP_014154532.1 hypothetical protein SARC_07021 [Sphaeroforma arctica JP610]
MATIRAQPKKEVPGTVLATLEYQWKIAHQYMANNQSSLSRQVLRCLLQMASENQFVLHPSVVQKMCTFCGTLYVPEETCHVRLQGTIKTKKGNPTSTIQEGYPAVVDGGRAAQDDAVVKSNRKPNVCGRGRTLHNPNLAAGKSIRNRFRQCNETTTLSHEHPGLSNRTRAFHNSHSRMGMPSNTSTVVMHCTYCSRNSIFAGGLRNERKTVVKKVLIAGNERPSSNYARPIASKAKSMEQSFGASVQHKVGADSSGKEKQRKAIQSSGIPTAKNGKITQNSKKGKKGLKAILQKNAREAQGAASGGDPRWASVNLGVFVCVECSGCHRELGTHVSKIKSVTHDKWDANQIMHLQRIGNEEVNNIYLAKLPKHSQFTAGDKNHIYAKYVQKRWFDVNGTGISSMTTEVASGSNANGGNTSRSNTSSASPPSLAPGEQQELSQKYSHQLVQLQGMGLTNLVYNLAALKKAHGDVGAAIDDLFANPPPEEPKAPEPASTESKSKTSTANAMSTLEGMGFTNKIACSQALRQADGDVQSAAEILLEAQGKAPQTDAAPQQAATSNAGMNTTPAQPMDQLADIFGSISTADTPSQPQSAQQYNSQPFAQQQQQQPQQQQQYQQPQAAQAQSGNPYVQAQAQQHQATPSRQENSWAQYDQQQAATAQPPSHATGTLPATTSPAPNGAQSQAQTQSPSAGGLPPALVAEGSSDPQPAQSETAEETAKRANKKNTADIMSLFSNAVSSMQTPQPQYNQQYGQQVAYQPQPYGQQAGGYGNQMYGGYGGYQQGGYGAPQQQMYGQPQQQQGYGGYGQQPQAYGMGGYDQQQSQQQYGMQYGMQGSPQPQAPGSAAGANAGAPIWTPQQLQGQGQQAQSANSNRSSATQSSANGYDNVNPFAQ